MKIGIFDSGLGGLLITRAIHDALPDHDLVYIGDTLHVPYGSRSKEAVYNLSENVIDYLFKEQDCALIIVACNTASASALRPLQQQYLIKNYPDRRILGVVIPTLETAIDLGHTNIGLIATENIIQSNIYGDELCKLKSDLTLHTQATPLLVPLIEHDGLEWVTPILKSYLEPLCQENIQSLILGCTHYPHLKSLIRKELGDNTTLISQDEIIPKKLKSYLDRHPEINTHLSKTGHIEFLVTDLTDSYTHTATQVYGDEVKLSLASL